MKGLSDCSGSELLDVDKQNLVQALSELRENLFNLIGVKRVWHESFGKVLATLSKETKESFNFAQKENDVVGEERVGVPIEWAEMNRRDRYFSSARTGEGSPHFVVSIIVGACGKHLARG